METTHPDRREGFLWIICSVFDCQEKLQKWDLIQGISLNSFGFFFFPPPPLPVGVFSVLPWQGSAFRILMSVFHPTTVVCLISSSLGNNTEVYCLVNIKKH